MTGKLKAMAFIVALSAFTCLPAFADDAPASPPADSSAQASDAKPAGKKAKKAKEAKASETKAAEPQASDAAPADSNAAAPEEKKEKKHKEKSAGGGGRFSFIGDWSKDACDYMKGATKKAVKGGLPFTVGFIGGTPIAIARCFKADTISGIKDLVGETKNPLLTLPASTLSIPFACISAPAKGVYFGASDSWRDCDKTPFTKDSFSLGEMK